METILVVLKKILQLSEIIKMFWIYLSATGTTVTVELVVAIAVAKPLNLQ
jgi:hypothetical protein